MNSLKKLQKEISWRRSAPAIILVLNSFVWYILTYNAIFAPTLNGLTTTGTIRTTLYAIYFLSVAFSAIFGPRIFRNERVKLIEFWLFIGVLATLLFTLISNTGVPADVLICLFFGVSIGIGLPSCLSYFAGSTSFSNRGSLGGRIWGSVGGAVLIFAFLINALGPLETIIALAIWRLIGAVGFVFLNKERSSVAAPEAPSYLDIIRSREVYLYLVPWVLFSVINFAETPLFERVFGTGFFGFLQLVEFAFIGAFAVIGGFIADITGRKRVVISGFIMLGIEYALTSVFSSSAAMPFIFLALDGITWGLFSSVLLMTIWADLGENHKREKYYTLGGLPFFLAGFLPIVIRPFAEAISTTTAFSIASFFLFLAVLPLMYAPETLPEKNIKDRAIMSYLEKAQQMKEKYS